MDEIAKLKAEIKQLKEELKAAQAVIALSDTYFTRAEYEWLQARVKSN